MKNVVNIVKNIFKLATVNSLPVPFSHVFYSNFSSCPSALQSSCLCADAAEILHHHIRIIDLYTPSFHLSSGCGLGKTGHRGRKLSTSQCLHDNKTNKNIPSTSEMFVEKFKKKNYLRYTLFLYRWTLKLFLNMLFLLL